MSQDGTTTLFGLRGVKVRDLDCDSDQQPPRDIAGPGRRAVHVVTDDSSAEACPACGALSRARNGIVGICVVSGYTSGEGDSPRRPGRPTRGSKITSDHRHAADAGFTQDVIDTWIDYKRVNEVDPVRLRPHPYEFQLYYDI